MILIKTSDVGSPCIFAIKICKYIKQQYIDCDTGF